MFVGSKVAQTFDCKLCGSLFGRHPLYTGTLRQAKGGGSVLAIDRVLLPAAHRARI